MKLSKMAVALLALAFAFPLLAQKENPQSCRKVCAIPNLTSEQTAKVQKLEIEHQKAMLLLQAELKAKRLDLCQLMREGADQKKIEAKIDEIAKAGADIQKKCLVYRGDILRLLTDEQKKTMTQNCMGIAGGCGIRGHEAGCGMRANSGCRDDKSCKSPKKECRGHEKKEGCASRGERASECTKK